MAAALTCLASPQTQALEIVSGANPAHVDDGMISKAYVARRGAVAHGGVYRGPRGGVYRHGTVYRGGAYRGGGYGYRGGYGYPGLAPCRLWRVGASRLVWLAGRRRHRRRRSDRSHRRGGRGVLRWRSSGSGTLLVLHQPKPHAGLLGRLSVAPGKVQTSAGNSQ